MAYLQRPQIILHDPPSDRTLRGAAMELKIPAITVEIRDPQRFQNESIKRSLIGLRSVLSEVGMLSKRTVAPGPPPVLCEDSNWLYTDHGGLLEVFPDVTDPVTEGEPIARPQQHLWRCSPRIQSARMMASLSARATIRWDRPALEFSISATSRKPTMGLYLPRRETSKAASPVRSLETGESVH